MGKIVLLQSGFSSIMSESLTKEEEEKKSITDQLMSSSIFEKTAVGYYDRDVKVIYQTLVDNLNSIVDFDFRERVLNKAISIFNSESDSIVEWFELQEKSPTVSYLHERFLVETLDVIYNVGSRKMAHSTYRRLLHTKTNAEIHQATDKAKEDRFVDLNNAIKTLGDIGTDVFLSKWTETTEGIQDLVMTMDVIAGYRQNPGF